MIKKYTDDFLEMGRPAPKLTSIIPRVRAYCDNLTAFGTDAKRVQELADRAAVGIEKEGFIVHERESAARYAIS
eukprot:14240355-Heterocapsa_arctica.AAC.1